MDNYQAHNNEVFASILRRFDDMRPEIGQVMATTAREYFLEQFGDSGGQYGKWPDKVSGEPATMFDTGNLYDKLQAVDEPGNFEVINEGYDTIVKLHVDALNKGFDYGAYQQNEQHRVFFEISHELAEKMKEAMITELGKLPGTNLMK